MKDDSIRGSRAILSNLHRAWSDGEAGPFYFRDPGEARQERAGGELPIPPPGLRMGYATHSDEVYLSCGADSSGQLRSILRDQGVVIGSGDVCLDWGCATGRVLRWFAEEAEYAEFWGLDQDERSIVWAKENLSPPFRFSTCTAYPHLPFPDETFQVVYALSVFTHVEHCVDLWLLEMRRVLRQGGCAVFTIHDEHTVRYFLENGRPDWIPADLELASIPEHEVTLISGETWDQVFTFLRTDYVRKEWGRYFDVAEIRPLTEVYQTGVVLRKR